MPRHSADVSPGPGSTPATRPLNRESGQFEHVCARSGPRILGSADLQAPCRSSAGRLRRSSVGLRDRSVLAHRSRSNACTHSARPPPSPLPRAAWSTGSRNPTSTAAPSCCSRPSSYSTPSPSSFRPRACIVIATTGSWLPMPGSGPTWWHSVGPSSCPRRRQPKAMSPHPAHPPSPLPRPTSPIAK